MIEHAADAHEATTRLTYARVHAGADGATHFENVAVGMASREFVPGIPLVDLASPQSVTTLTFARLAAGYTSDWHPAPRRQFVLLLTGAMEVTVSDGETRTFGPGQVVLVEDTAGAGHQTRTRGADACLFVAVAC